MLSTKEKIKNIISKNPKLYSQIIKRDKELFAWVDTYYGDTLSEKIYNSVNDVNRVCPNGNRYKFRSYNDGYKYCGRANACDCARKSVSLSVSETKKTHTAETKTKTNLKRAKTNLQRYGVENIGQTDSAKKKHKEFYESSNNIDSVNAKIQRTLMETYGVSNARDIPGVNEKIAATLLDRHNVHNISHIDGVLEKRVKTRNTKYPDFSEHMLGKWYDKLKDKYIDDLNIKMLTPRSEYKGIGSKYEYVCLTCSTKFKFKPTGSSPAPRCKTCNPVHGSKEQEEVYDFVKSLGISNISCNNREILNGKELDIYLPDYNIAIEYNGVYWHNDLMVDKNYHYAKFLACKEKGIDLYNIFSSQWKNNQKIIKSMLQSKLHKSNNDVVYARKCEIRDVAAKEAGDFLTKTHIFGKTASKYKIGLYHNNVLVSLMCFSPPRLGIGNNQHGIELVRYASSSRVVGGASKLLKYFIKTYTPNEIYSFSDNCYSNGNLYNTLGFQISKEYKPSYWYCDPSTEKLYHRFNFRKDRLAEHGFDKEKFTEKEIMIMLGFWRVWDAGKIKWILKIE